MTASGLHPASIPSDSHPCAYSTFAFHPEGGWVCTQCGWRFEKSPWAAESQQARRRQAAIEDTLKTLKRIQLQGG